MAHLQSASCHPTREWDKIDHHGCVHSTTAGPAGDTGRDRALQRRCGRFCRNSAPGKNPAYQLQPDIYRRILPPALLPAVYPGTGPAAGAGLFHQGQAVPPAGGFPYRKNGAHPASATRQQALAEIAGQYEGRNQRHLENAFRVHLQHSWKDVEVIAVEKPFAMLIDPHLPPCVGVIDLVRQAGRYLRSLWIIRPGGIFTRRMIYKAPSMWNTSAGVSGMCSSAFYYDHYRWVENLQRIRKPALQRTRLISPEPGWLPWSGSGRGYRDD